jgi:hypothetical protein
MAEIVAARWTRGRAYLLAVATAFLSGCGSGLDAREMTVEQLYLVCYDCVGPLDSVRAFAVRKPVATVDSLNVALLTGPGSSAARDSAITGAFIRDSAYRATHGRPPLGVTRVVYLTDTRNRYDGGYRSRAAIALGWIHDVRALADLNAALVSPLPPDVRKAVKFAIDSLP